ncbi:serine O-acetyltransferase [Psychromonas sp. 14N.309.X.WAT.B.A12]|uniref:serine O-acetyltransferase n=1 Tax=unclassified Psychromonas TaxID=2614957 RepID=UPI0025B16E38|nr:serine O-acetyltransferase [Psychromonas sp. 14N.309.X.WAT.B.A12]MDN2664693.1 serine O-acetyltransferase [Psychromonas sp. 14N.309.X.WAT.B.A12]
MQCNVKNLWEKIRQEAWDSSASEPILASFFHSTILNHKDLASALSYQLANRLDSRTMPGILVREVIDDAFSSDPTLIESAMADILAVQDRDPAVEEYSIPLLYLKGFHAIQIHRVAHWLWQQKRIALAFYLQNRSSVIFGVDVHPAATIGKGIMFDHATGVVVGETAVIEDNVSLLQGVTLGGTGKESGDRHPKIRQGVMIGAGAKVLGNIEIGMGAKIGAGSVVLEAVPAHTTVAGVPAKVVGRPSCDMPSLSMEQNL